MAAVMDPQPEKARKTQFGTLYAPQTTLVQLVTLVGALLGGFAIAKIVIWALGRLSDTGEIGVYIAFAAVLFIGYGFWSARLKTIAFQDIGKGILIALFMLIVRRQKPNSLEELLPTEEKLTAMAVAAQQASSFFAVAGVLVTAIAAPISLLFEAEAAASERLLIVGVGLVVWGVALALLGRRGYLPILESEG